MGQTEASDPSVRTVRHDLHWAPGPEPADPDANDMSRWQPVEPGSHSGFGSLDMAYSKSLPPGDHVTDSIHLQGWKGERVHCKLLIWSSESEEQITITTDGLQNDHYRIGKKDISISVIQYVLVDEFLNERGAACGPRDNDKTPVHLRPDILSPASGFLAQGPGTRPVWISVDIPTEAPAGLYEGTVSRHSASGTVAHRITLEVLNKSLPDPADWSFHLDLWQNPYAVARVHEVEVWSQEHLDLMRPLLTLLANAGQKCITTTLNDKPWGDDKPCYDDFGAMIKWTRKKDGTWDYDYTWFDQYVGLAMACGINKQINCYSMVPVGNQFSWFDEATSQTIRIEATPETVEYEDLWRPFLVDFAGHLKEKGWLDRTTLALDERGQEEMKRLFEFLKDTAPELKISMAGFYYADVNPLIHDFSSNWRDGGRIPEEAIQLRRASGLVTTYYVACGIPRPNNFTFSPPSESCVEGWIAAAMGFDGFLRWAANSWPQDPLTDSRYSKWPSGDTYLVYPFALSSVRFERLREGIQDYEKIRILREDLAGDHSAKAVAARARLDSFLNSIDAHTLDHLSAAQVLEQGKQILYDIVKSVYTDPPSAATEAAKDRDLQLLGHRFLTFTTVVRVRQIEVTRDRAIGPDESSIHTPREARLFREAIEEGWPGARITWAFSWLALKDQRANYRDLRQLVVLYHHLYGDEITFIPGAYFSNMYNTRDQVNRDLHEGLEMVSDMVGGGYRPQSVIAGFLSADNLRYLAEEEDIHVCQGTIWSQYAVDNGDGEGSISYPYYPSREHFCKPAQGEEDVIDCVNLDGWTVDFLNARYARARIINGIRCGSRQGVGPIETLLRQGTEIGLKEMLATTAAHFDRGFELNRFAWVTTIWEMGLVEARKIYGYQGRNGLDGLVMWLSEIRRRWPDARCITKGEFGLLWREQFKNNDDINYRFVQRGSGVCGSEPELEIKWFMNKDFRMALLRDWKADAPEQVIDFTRYDLPAREPEDPEPGQHTRNWSLMNRLNQKGTRPQDKPVSLGQLSAAEQAIIRCKYPELIPEAPEQP
ncbi:MAG: DUF3863 domain-containing protein [Phycisphaerae bacterium]|nr:DUF3863 domain-containing protein [Phycisphaerae bacterium]